MGSSPLVSIKQTSGVETSSSWFRRTSMYYVARSCFSERLLIRRRVHGARTSCVSGSVACLQDSIEYDLVLTGVRAP